MMTRVRNTTVQKVADMSQMARFITTLRQNHRIRAAHRRMR